MKVHDKPPPHLQSLMARLENVSKASGVARNRAQRHIAIAVAGQFLLAVDGAAAIKGASSLEARLGTTGARVSRDLDAVRRDGREAFEEELRERLAEGWGGFTGTLALVREIRAPVPSSYTPHEYRLSLGYEGKPFANVQLEVSAEEIEALALVDEVVPPDASKWMTDMGLPQPAPIPSNPRRSSSRVTRSTPPSC